MSELLLDILVAALLLLGSSLCLLAAVGLVRMPDIMMRIHAGAKAGSLGCTLVLSAVAVFHGDLDVIARAFAGIVFIVITAPVGAHMIGRAAYIAAVPLWNGTETLEAPLRHPAEPPLRGDGNGREPIDDTDR